MTSNDRPQIADFPIALGLLSRLPLPIHMPDAQTRAAAGAWAWPVAGAVIGVIAGVIGLGALALGLPPVLAAGLALAAGPILTGGMHEDGLADTADGLWGGWTQDRRLAIMKDSHIGTYGVIALILSFGLRAAALTILFENGPVIAALIGTAVLSRLPMVALSWGLPHARPNGLSASVGRPSGLTLGLALFATLILTIPTLGLATAPALIAVALTTLALAGIAQAKIGGQTGDILGAGQQLGEITTLLTLAALAS